MFSAFVEEIVMSKQRKMKNMPVSRLCPDLPRSSSCVCSGGFPSHCHEDICFLQLAFREEELAVCDLWHRRLH